MPRRREERMTTRRLYVSQSPTKLYQYTTPHATRANARESSCTERQAPCRGLMLLVCQPCGFARRGDGRPSRAETNSAAATSETSREALPPRTRLHGGFPVVCEVETGRSGQ